MAAQEVDEMECPMCNGNRSCPECDGLSDVVCDVCDGKSDECEQCVGTGRYVCKPCDGSGVCPRCGGEAEIEISGGQRYARSRAWFAS